MVDEVSSRIAGCMYMFRRCGRSALIAASEIHPHPYHSQHSIRLNATPTAHWHHHHPSILSSKQAAAARLMTAEASLCQRFRQPTRVQPVPCPSKHCCAPWFHDCPSILARPAHGRAGTCACCSTIHQQHPPRAARRPLPLRTIKAQGRVCSLAGSSVAPARAGLDVHCVFV